ncbi:hypothetical protein CCUS01_01154 [Colletotrichum cuscutae]|uniref:Uncharacterized protein n=1 Tax=Colletotrichum cuscutae TaxID=1209917 RepID=A0AAI9V093_9PEZI|nr:hypothetical protein CCUS01_01154 [Colletotrichum cuscutae]
MQGRRVREKKKKRAQERRLVSRRDGGIASRRCMAKSSEASTDGHMS